MKFTKSIKKNHQFRYLYHKGRSNVTPFIAIYTKDNRNKSKNFLGITVGTKVGNAVVRNRVRRRIREAYRTHEDNIKSGYSLVVVARNRCATASYQQIERALLGLLKQQKLLLSPQQDEV